MVETTSGDSGDDEAKGVMGCHENLAFFIVDMTPFNTCSSSL